MTIVIKDSYLREGNIVGTTGSKTLLSTAIKTLFKLL